MSGESIFASIVGFALGVYFLGNNAETPRYQVASYGESKAIVLDTKTGEAWTSTTTKICGIEMPALSPLKYAYKQANSKDVAVYTPEETRNKSNSSWWSRINQSEN